jgi:hypothetical protein
MSVFLWSPSKMVLQGFHFGARYLLPRHMVRLPLKPDLSIMMEDADWHFERCTFGHPQKEERQRPQVLHLRRFVSLYKSSISLDMPASFLPFQVRQPVWAWAGCVLVRLHRRAPRHLFVCSGSAGRPAHGQLPHPGGDRTAALLAAQAEALTGTS